MYTQHGEFYNTYTFYIKYRREFTATKTNCTRSNVYLHDLSLSLSGNTSVGIYAGDRLDDALLLSNCEVTVEQRLLLLLGLVASLLLLLLLPAEAGSGTAA